jgi:hypothetical protein
MKLPFTAICSVSVLQPLVCFDDFEKTDDTAHGICLSGNDQFTIFALNIVEN